MKEKFNDFIKVTQILNKKGITPVLYGSLGLYKIIGEVGEINDIDFLIPKIWLESKWDEFRKYLESNNFKLISEHEHEFSHPEILNLMAFGNLEDAKEYSGLEINELHKVESTKANYLALDVKQYLSAYQESLKDGYRHQKKENTDAKKIEAIKNFMKAEKICPF